MLNLRNLHSWQPDLLYMQHAAHSIHLVHKHLMAELKTGYFPQAKCSLTWKLVQVVIYLYNNMLKNVYFTLYTLGNTLKSITNHNNNADYKPL